MFILWRYFYKGNKSDSEGDSLATQSYEKISDKRVSGMWFRHSWGSHELPPFVADTDAEVGESRFAAGKTNGLPLPVEVEMERHSSYHGSGAIRGRFAR